MTQKDIVDGSKIIANYLGWQYIPFDNLQGYSKAGWWQIPFLLEEKKLTTKKKNYKIFVKNIIINLRRVILDTQSLLIKKL